MDLLLTPADPAFATDDTPFLAGDKRWELGRFQTYAGHNHISTIANLKALAREELNGFLQTWLFFGLVAEFLGLNEQEDGNHIVDPSQARAELDVLYEESVVVKEDGKEYITGAKVLDLMPLIQERIMAAAEFADGIGPRLMYLDLCVDYAYQIRMDEYQPAHIEECRGCDFLYVDLDGMMSILEKTRSFPVLKGKTAWNEVYKRNEAQVEAFEPGLPYVAISHVWADGLGNPATNSLPRCQVDRLVSLVAKLQKSVDPDWEERGQNPYRFWVDPLCCPVESNGKSIALERIAYVYRNATHVLVLDTSFTSFSSEIVEPAELLFRAVSCSAWMRRLWTLQEGALARSLYYQFADCAMTREMLLSKAFETGHKDIRHRWLRHALLHELRPFVTFPPHMEPGSLEHMPNSIRDPHHILWKLQYALICRSVSVPRDEPLCIATILGLDIGRIANENGADATQKRMAILWEMLAETLGGIPPGAVFYVDNPLDIVGFRWAPKSLLAAEFQQSTGDDTSDPYAERPFFDSALNMFDRGARFSCGPDTKLAQLVSEGDRRGLRMSYPGFKVYARPYPGVDAALEKYRLQPWVGVLAHDTQYVLLLKEEEVGRWFKVRMAGITLESGLGVDDHTATSICKAIHTGHCAIIRQTAETSLWLDGSPETEDCLLVLVMHEDETELIVRTQYRVVIREATEAQTIVAETMTELAAKLAGEQVTADFIAARDQIESDEYELARDGLIERMKEVVAVALEARPDFAQAAEASEGKDSQYYMWVGLAGRYSHRIILERMPDNQVWLID